jgi:hypothetical protein
MTSSTHQRSSAYARTFSAQPMGESQVSTDEPSSVAESPAAFRTKAAPITAAVSPFASRALSVNCAVIAAVQANSTPIPATARASATAPAPPAPDPAIPAAITSASAALAISAARSAEVSGARRPTMAEESIS